MEEITNAEQQTPALTIISAALTQVDDVLQKATQSLALLQQNIQQVSAQKIALEAQKGMLTELKARIDSEEKKAKKNEK